MGKDPERERLAFAKRLNEACDDAGVPAKHHGRQGALASLFGVTQKGARKWLEGESMPSPTRWPEFGAKLHVRPEWLFLGQGGKTEASRTASVIDRPPTLSIPLLSSFASMGLGFPVQEHETVIDNLRLSQDWCRRNLNVSNLGNLAALSAYGDSMRPTFDDGDILIVDRGISSLTVDAVYVLQFRDELYVKRIQRRPDGAVVIRSDNALYEPLVIDPASDGLRVLGRVVWAWNGRKL
ncbi:MAG: helix-turn-helix transcriptional regulator [Gammaproteobacteria bacterium]|nr:helix-turn-helix transcriptional regulator [Gammaproteobacteria bacterium]